MKQSKPYPKQEESTSVVKESETMCYVGAVKETSSTVKKVDWTTFPGQYTEEEKRSRLLTAVEDTVCFTHEEVKAMAIAWKH